ncbi:MAG TPA: homoserine kinase [Casimicrobiaceae bacterium]|nr:homoserine kinase [Casimicrobiaceae bacterium]
MSVYTKVTDQELAAWLMRYALGEVHAFEPIAAGIENTNYFLTADKGRYVLTLYERLPPEELPFYLNLTAHLARAGVKAPAPEPDRTGALWSFLNGKPASLVARLDGSPVTAPDVAHCAAVGAALAELHLAAKQYRGRLGNRRGLGWWRQAARAVRPFLSPEQNALAASELKHQSALAKVKLPRGAIHGDLFCDNVLFVDGRVSGIIDFGFAATDALAYDVAITVNDWCSAGDGAAAGVLDGERTRALVTAYNSVRPFDFDERAQWSNLLRAAALRFWLSRLYDLHLPRPGELTHAHDPSAFERILRDRVANPPLFPHA